MANRREIYAKTLDGLLDAGNDGEPLQAQHIPHLCEKKLQIVLPGILAANCFHVAEINLGNGRIQYKHTVSRSEAQRRRHLRFLSEAEAYASSQWGGSLCQFGDYHIRQVRDSRNNCTWSVVNGAKNVIMRTGHRSEFMELAGDCVVLYDG